MNLSSRWIFTVGIALVLLSAPAPSFAGISVGPIENPANSHSYFRLTGSSWIDLEAQAVALGGHLVTLSDSAELTWLAGKFTFDGVAIGYSDSATEGMWVWVNGEAAPPPPWMPGHPSSARGDEDYAMLRGPTSTASLANADFRAGIAEVPFTTSPLVVSGPLTNSANGHVYYVLDGMNWLDLEHQAVMLGGHLATLSSAAEESWIAENFSGLGTLAIGINDSSSEGVFHWTSGELVVYTRWQSGQPDNLGDQDYVAWLPGSPAGWRDESIALTRGLVEIGPIDKYVDVVVLEGPIFNPATGSTYYRVSAGDWARSEDYAKDVFGGHLVSVNDPAESVWLLSNLHMTSSVWIGLNDVSVEGSYGWTSLEPLTWTHWAPGEPNDGDVWVSDGRGGLIFHDGAEDFACMAIDGTWSDLNSGITQAIIEVRDLPPIANLSATAATAVSADRVDAPLHLDGSRSTDPEGAPLLRYDWSLDGAWIAAGVTADIRVSMGTHRIDLTVSDGRMSGSATGSVVVSFVNHPPDADASATLTEVVSANRTDAEVLLDGSLSSDPDAVDAAHLAFEWVVDGRTVALARTATVTLGVGVHEVTLFVRDPDTSDSDSRSIRVESANAAPLADLSATAIEAVSFDRIDSDVLLDGSRTSDPDHDPLHYLWTVDGVPVAAGVTAKVRIPLGRHRIELVVSDGSFVVAATTFISVVFENHPPNADMSATRLVVESSNRIDAPVTLDASLSSDPDRVDNDRLAFEWIVDGRTVAIARVAEVTLAVGVHEVTLLVLDPDVTATDSRTVTVTARNVEPIAEAGSDAVVEATSPAGASVALSAAGSSDPDGDALTYLWSGDFGRASGVSPSISLGFGSHTIALTVTDSRGASSIDTVLITVRDGTAPVITSLSATPATLTTPNHKMVAVTLSGTATDAVDAAPALHILSVTSNEPTDGLGDGDTPIDWEVTGAMTLNLRAERSGKGTGRIYTMTVQATDASGNSSVKTVTVTVPKGSGK